ncbi:hypothetical protein LguiA_035246 [Lonicera macranthoides]
MHHSANTKSLSGAGEASVLLFCFMSITLFGDANVDVRGDLFGMLSAHPLSPLLSLHHFDIVDPIFPGKSNAQALEHLFKAANIDQSRMLQKTICYDRSKSFTLSLSWGYAVQIFEGNQLVPDLLPVQRTFRPWKRGRNAFSSHYMFNTKEYPRDPCKRPVTFFLENAVLVMNGVYTAYTRHGFADCLNDKRIQSLEHIRVFSQKLHINVEQVKAPRRQCCDIVSSYNKTLLVASLTLTGTPQLKGLEVWSSLMDKIQLDSLGAQVATEKEYSLLVPEQDTPSSTSIDHIVFGIASNKNSWPNRKEYVKLWWNPTRMRGCVFLDSLPDEQNSPNLTSDLPPVCVSDDTSRFRYTYRGGLRSAIRVARVVLETVALNHTNVRWFVFGDDDTVFFPENLVKTLSKYDHGLWYYIGSNSESYMQNRFFSFNMAFGGAGFAISYPLAKVLARVFDSCIERYPHLYGSDGRISTCLAELGVGLTREPGFHQMDIRGDLVGLLTTHPLNPLVSLHHLDASEPIFPNKTTNKAIRHLFQASSLDPHRLLQQTVCYDRWFSWTISVSWGYAVQVYANNVFLPDVLRARQTFNSWKRGHLLNGVFNFDTWADHPDPCRRPTVFFMDMVGNSADGTTSSYRRLVQENCSVDRASPRSLDEIRVFSRKLDLDIKQLQAPRRQCCDVLPSTNGKVMEIGIRECKEDELIYMHP